MNVEFLVSQNLYWFVWYISRILYIPVSFFLCNIAKKDQEIQGKYPVPWSQLCAGYLLENVEMIVDHFSMFIRWFIPFLRWARPKYLPVKEHSVSMYLGNTAVFACVADLFIRRSCESLFFVFLIVLSAWRLHCVIFLLQ